MKTNKEIKIVDVKRVFPLITTKGKKIYAVEFEGAIFFEEGEEQIVNEMIEEKVKKIREQKIIIPESVFRVDNKEDASTITHLVN